MECEIARVFHDTHHFNEFGAGARRAAETLADWIFVLEKLARKSLIDNCYFSRTWPILRGDAAPFNDWGSDDVKISRRHSIPGSEKIIRWPGRRMAFHPDGSAPCTAHLGRV